MPDDYRTARKAFIAACEAAGIDAIARVQPGKAADGKPLFMDAAALGPRDAQKAVLLVSRDAAGSGVQTRLLRDGIAPPQGARLVLVHALDPGVFAGGAGDPGWARAMLGAVATEDLSKAQTLALLVLGGDAAALKSAVAERLPESNINVMSLAADPAAVRGAVAAFFGLQ